MKFSKILYEASKPEADKDDIFGQYLFAPNRYDVPPEKNTKKEDELFYALKDMFEDKGDGKLRKFSKKILELLAANKYKKLLSTSYPKAYRGIRITKEALLEIISPHGEEIKYDTYVTMNLPNRFKPMEGTLLQSWSVDQQQAAKFAGYPRPAGRVVSVVFVASINGKGNNFFGNPFLAGLVSPQYEEEQEVISVGPIKCDGFAYFVNKNPKNEEISEYRLMNAAMKIE